MEIGQAAESASSDAKEAKKALDITNEFEKKVNEGANKLNPLLYTHGVYLSTINGESPVVFPSLSLAAPIEIIKGEDCSIINENDSTASGSARYSYFYDKNMKYVAEHTISKRHNDFVAPLDGYVRAAIYNGESSEPNIWDMELTGIFKEQNPIFEKYGSTVTLELIGKTNPTELKNNREPALIEDVKKLAASFANGRGDLEFNIQGSELKVIYPEGYITALIKEDRGQSGNNMFNFKEYLFNGISSGNEDDVAPMHILNTTLGANHGQPCAQATVAAHGKSNKNIGTEWIGLDGIKFYIVGVVNANTLIFLSENKGTYVSPKFESLVNGNLTSGADSLIVTSVIGKQLYPSIANLQFKVIKDKKEVVTDDGLTRASSIDVVESYEIMHPVDILNNLIAKVGNEESPNYIGKAVVRVENVYSFQRGMALLIPSNCLPMQDISFRDFMFTQAVQVAKDAKYYIPGIKPNAIGKNFTKPLEWDKAGSSLLCSPSACIDPAKPITRIMQIKDNVAFVIGYVPGYGAAANLLENSLNTFEIRGNSGKIYPHGYDSNKQGETLSKGKIYNAAMYRCFVDLDKVAKDGRMCMHHFEYDNDTIVIIDYSASMELDKIEVDSKLNGKKIEDVIV